jgi:uncharacterized protein (TIGR02722 family)
MKYIVAIMVLVLTACSGPRVERLDASVEMELTDGWNARDSREVSEGMMGDMLSFPWYGSYLAQHNNQRPTVLVQQIRNASHEHIAVDTFVNDIKRSLMMSGKIEFVAGGAERVDIRDEKADQAGNATAATQKALGQEIGADYVLTGVINSYVDQLKDKRVTYYQVDLKLIELLTNREVWIGTKKIQKLMTK